MKSQRRFAPTGGEFTPESVARFTGIRTYTTSAWTKTFKDSLSLRMVLFMH